MIGKAREIYTQLGVEQSHHYETVKELIFKGYELVPEAYRQKFRNCKKDSNQTHVEFARNKEQLFDRWCCSKKIDQNYDKLRQLVLVEEFKRYLVLNCEKLVHSTLFTLTSTNINQSASNLVTMNMSIRSG